MWKNETSVVISALFFRCNDKLMARIPALGIFSVTFAGFFSMRQVLNNVGTGAMAFF